jgi:hypothetical protein
MPDLEEHTIESLPDRCASCGAALTESEKQAALETGATPVLCTTCSVEQAPAVEEVEEAEVDY